MTKIKEEDATKNRKMVLFALAQMTLGNKDEAPINEGKEFEEKIPQYKFANVNPLGVSSHQITDYIKKKNEISKTREIENIEKKYEKGEIDSNRKEIEIHSKREKDVINLRTVQRSLQFFIRKGLVIREGGKYKLSEDAIENLKSYSGTFGHNVLQSLMRIHQPGYNSTKKNVSRLITLFGWYVFYCLLEASRPINDEYFVRSGYNPMTTEEKNNFTEKWLKDAIDVSLLYRYFIETFLNQPDDNLIEKLKAAKPSGYKPNKDSKMLEQVFTDADGNEYRGLALVELDGVGYVNDHGEGYVVNYDSSRDIPKTKFPFFIDAFSDIETYEIPLEIEEKLYNKIIKIFSEKDPTLYQKLIDNPSNIYHGLKNIEAIDFYTKVRKN